MRKPLRFRRALLFLVPVVWLGFAYGLWQRRRRRWVHYRARPSTLADVGAALWGSLTAILLALLVWGIWFRQIHQVYYYPSIASELRQAPIDSSQVLTGDIEGTNNGVYLTNPLAISQGGTGAGTGTVTTDAPPRLSSFTRSLAPDGYGHVIDVTASRYDTCIMDRTHVGGMVGTFVVSLATTRGWCHAQALPPHDEASVIGYLVNDATTAGQPARIWRVR
jgi:hypothetical protein